MHNNKSEIMQHKKAAILEVRAGPQAFTHLQQHGLQLNDVSSMIGASGGPKWFVLFGLDQYLAEKLIKPRHHRQPNTSDPVQHAVEATTALRNATLRNTTLPNQALTNAAVTPTAELPPLTLLGSSAGAWRFAALAQADPAAASRRFCDAYRQLCYRPEADIAEVTEVSKQVLAAILPDAASRQSILTQTNVRLNMIVARARHLCARRGSLPLLTGLGLAACSNLLHRRALGAFYQRVLFHHPASAAAIGLDAQLPNIKVALSHDNIADALFASGSIPAALEGVSNIAGAPKGVYVDGGVTDYHISLPICEPGLTLYPHFYPHLTPGWFDKSLPWRRTLGHQLPQVVMLSPSAAWVSSLPGGKLPDRHDFAKLSDAQRIARWQQVIERSHELADALAQGHYSVQPL
jgi:hypothetical protein